MSFVKYSPPGLGMSIWPNTWKPRKCVVCKRMITKPGAKNQKVHDGRCRRTLALQRAVNFQRKQKAAKAFKKERKRIGVIKAIKPAQDPEYLEWLRSQYCAVGERNGSEECSRVIEAAHVGATRGLRQKCPDRLAIPLCIHHHRTGKESHHNLQRKFWGFHLIDREATITEYNARYEAERKAA